MGRGLVTCLLLAVTRASHLGQGGFGGKPGCMAPCLQPGVNMEVGWSLELETLPPQGPHSSPSGACLLTLEPRFAQSFLENKPHSLQLNAWFSLKSQFV